METVPERTRLTGREVRAEIAKQTGRSLTRPVFMRLLVDNPGLLASAERIGTARTWPATMIEDFERAVERDQEGAL